MTGLHDRTPASRTPAASAGVDRQFTSELIKVMYERDARCPDCRYSLSGLVGHRCPECGRSVAEFLRMVDTMPRRWALAKQRMFDRRIRYVLVVLMMMGVSCAIGLVLAGML